MNTLFPVFIKLENLHVLIVGGGYVGFEKLNAVVSNSPHTNVTIVAPYISPQVQALASSYSNIQLVFEPYHTKFLTNINLVLAATNDKAVNVAIQQDCKANNILVNVADTPDLCNFYLSSVVKKGDLKIAISTNGKSPTFAKRFREILEEILPDTLQETLDNLLTIRNKLHGDFQEKLQKLNEITKVMKSDN